MSLDKNSISKEIKEGHKLETHSNINIIPKETTNSQNQTYFSEKKENPLTNFKVEGSPETFIEIGKQNQKITYKRPSTGYTTTKIITKSNIISNENQRNMKEEENIHFENIADTQQNIIGIPFDNDKLNEIMEENSANQKNKNIIIKTKYEVINNNEGGKIKNNNYNTKETYTKNIVKKGNIYSKKKGLKNNNENINNQAIIQTIEKKSIINPKSEIKKEIIIEKAGENKNEDFQIEKKLTLDDNIDANSNNDSNFLDNESHNFDYSDMSEKRFKRFKSFVSHNSNSTDKIDDLFSSVDFRVQRTKTIKDINISKFTEEDDEKEETDEIDENEKVKFTNIKYITNNIPILKENEFNNLIIEIKPMIEKCEKYYNEYLNKQDSKEEITQKNEIITTTRKEKKIIGIGGKITDKLNASDSINTLNNDKEITNESIEINASMKKELLDESDSMEKSYKQIKLI